MKKLKVGDTIGIIATSGAIEDCESIARGCKLFEERGYKVVVSEGIYEESRYLAGTDESRVQELHKFFADPQINAIICFRGGYGAIRIINMLDYDLIRKNPKIFCGYSDISALSAMMLKRAGLITYSGPMFQSDFGAKEPSEFTINAFFDALTKDRLTSEGTKTYRSGNAEGILWGGNLMTIASLCGQDFIPDEKFIFFTEDLNEKAYQVDRMMTQLLNIEKFRNNIQAIILGNFLGMDNQEWLDEFWEEIAQKLQIPVAGGFKITHGPDKVTIPYGVKATLRDLEVKV